MDRRQYDYIAHIKLFGCDDGYKGELAASGKYRTEEAYQEALSRLTTAETLLSRWLEGCENGWSWSPISDTRAFLTLTQEADNGSK